MTMETFEVETALVIHCRVKVLVQSDSRQGAIEVAAAVLPHNHILGSCDGWKADVKVKPPKGVTVTTAKAYHFEQASGADKARKVRP